MFARHSQGERLVGIGFKLILYHVLQSGIKLTLIIFGQLKNLWNTCLLERFYGYNLHGLATNAFFHLFQMHLLYKYISRLNIIKKY